MPSTAIPKEFVFLKKQTETKIRRKKRQIALQQQVVQLTDGSNPVTHL